MTIQWLIPNKSKEIAVETQSAQPCLLKRNTSSNSLLHSYHPFALPLYLTLQEVLSSAIRCLENKFNREEYFM